MKRVLLIATGGTIACKDAGEGLTPQLTSSDLMALVPELDQICLADAVQLMNLDSTNISSTHWLEMAACIQKHYDQYDGFVLTHGTDTMAYTAAALSYLIQNSRKPIVITGAQQSISNRDTDARENLRDAFLYASDDQACGVHIVFDHKVILGTRARKMRTKSYNAFESVDWPETAIIRNRKLVYYFPVGQMQKHGFIMPWVAASLCGNSFPVLTRMSFRRLSRFAARSFWRASASADFRNTAGRRFTML